MGLKVLGVVALVLTATLLSVPVVEAAAMPAGGGLAQMAVAKAEPTRMVIVEVVEDGGKGKPHRRRFWLAVSGRRPSRVELHDGQVDYELDLRKERDDGSQADLHLTLDHTRRHADKRVSRARLSVSRRVSIGKPTVMATIGQPGGGRLRVIATLR